MQELRCDHDNPLYDRVVKAQQVMQDLAMELHYESCGNGVWRARGT